MIEKQLNIGDHIVDAKGHIYVIDGVSKTSYRARRSDDYYDFETVPFNGIRKRYSFVLEFFVCDDVQLKIIENLNKENKSLQQKLAEQEQDVLQTRTFKENLEWLYQNKLSDLERDQDDDYDEDDEEDD